MNPEVGRHPEDQWSPERHDRGYETSRWLWFALVFSPAMTFLLVMFLLCLGLAS